MSKMIATGITLGLAITALWVITENAPLLGLIIAATWITASLRSLKAATNG